MRAIELSNGALRLATDYPDPTPPPGAVCVRVLQAGICETDLQLIAGYMGFEGVLGHEFVGVASSGALAGKRVVGEINCICHGCSMCQRGLGNHCPHRTVIGILQHDGAFADALIVPEANLHEVPDAISNDQATLVEPLAAALQIPEQVALTPEMVAYVVGDGRLGNLCAQVLQRAGCRTTVVGKHAAKLASLSALGMDTCLLENRDMLPSADLVVDCAGTESGLETAISLVRPRGTVVMKTTIAAPHALALAPIVIDEITLIGSRCGPFDKAIQALQAGDFQLDGFIGGRYPLEEFQAAFQQAAEKNTLKVIFEIGRGDEASGG